MADEAFALSPISARAAQPREEDYDAISEAFMETSRGRWFLGEYAKRNRNADTRMVLDAVARIEQSLAAQKQPEPEPVPDTRLADALTAIKAALSEARAAASGVVDGLALEHHLAPVRKGARVIREISWRWREIGADGRICDLLDSQVSAIEASCGQLSFADPHAALGAAFDLLGRSIAAFDDSDDALTAEATANNAEAAANAEPVEAVPPATLAAEAPVAMAPAATDANVETGDQTAEASDVTAATTEVVSAMEPPAESAAMTPEAADAQDEALLDMIAAEMGAPDPSDDEFDGEPGEMELDDLPCAEPEMIASSEEIAVAPEIVSAVQPTSPQPAAEPAPEPSLGSTLIASGFLRRSAASADPLASIRRLSQVEKIALFS